MEIKTPRSLILLCSFPRRDLETDWKKEVIYRSKARGDGQSLEGNCRGKYTLGCSLSNVADGMQIIKIAETVS